MALNLADTVVQAATRVGKTAADLVADTAAHHGADSVKGLVRRGRLHLARAVATHTIDQVGRQLTRRCRSEPAIEGLIADVRIGVIDDPDGRAVTNLEREDHDHE